MRGELPNPCEIIFVYRRKKLPVCFSLILCLILSELIPCHPHVDTKVWFGISEIAHAKLSIPHFYAIRCIYKEV